MITFTLNGKKISCNEGETILNASINAGYEIPNLCYDCNLKTYGACGLCLVEGDGIPKLMRACSAKASDGMVLHTDSQRAASARKTALELLMSDHEGDCKGPCSLNCPAGTDVQNYIKAIALGEYTEAVKIIKEKIPIPASIGRVCPHPCEKNCRRGMVEAPLSIAYLKAFAADRDLESENGYVPAVAAKTGKKVAIVGGGPAGLACAFRLVLEGHDITIYDAMPEMGGMLRYGIPEYRLPKKVLRNEIRLIEDLGVKMKNNVMIGKDITLSDLKKDNDAVLVAAGAWSSMGMRCKGEDLEGVIGGIDFLRKVNCGEEPGIGKNVAVVGGGNTAMDACRTAVRCGAEHVYVIYRRTRAEAPAEDIEITEAIEEGVDFRFLTNPDEIIGENGKVKAIRLQVMELGEPDASGRRSPVPVEGKFITLDVDSVIVAIGQKLNSEGFKEVGLTEKGTISAEKMTGRTAMDGVFAAGDATNRGASIAIDAIGEGNEAAYAISAYLKGEEYKPFKPYYSKKNVTPEMLADKQKEERQEMPVNAPEARKKSFDEVIKGFSEEQARKEASRCLECGCHDFKECKLIRYANQQPIDPSKYGGSIHDSFKEQKLPGIERDQGKCILCNLCVRTCNETVGKGILGLVGRGFSTVIKPEFNTPETVNGCLECHKCADSCPTGALKIFAQK